MDNTDNTTTFKIVRTNSLKVGDPVFDFYPSEEDVQAAIADASLLQDHIGFVSPAAAEDLAEVDEWPWAIVPVVAAELTE